MNKLYTLILIAYMISINGCKEPYNIPVHSNNLSILIVEGALNTGQGSSKIRLTRSGALNDPINGQIPETNAQLTIEGDNGSYSMIDNGNGNYETGNLSLEIGKSYRLRIKTANGKEYLSDYILAKDNPPIDSISWDRDNKGVNIYANTHDPLNNTRYYRWDFEQTWEIHTFFVARYKYENGQILERPASEYVNICWSTNSSSNILIGSTAKLQSDVIYKNPLLLIPNNSEQLAVRYSILVRQYALTKEAFEFYQLMKKNTETIGSVFDAQPSEITGNIHSLSDSTEQVIGFISVSPIREKRIFIDRSQIDDWVYREDCHSQYVTNNPDSIKAVIPSAGLPYDAQVLGISILGYYYSIPQCVDCTTRGGSLNRPAFW